MIQRSTDVKTLHGVVFTKIEGLEESSEKVTLYTSSGDIWEMSHDQDCCEVVILYDVEGDIDDLLNSPIVMAEESNSTDNLPVLMLDRNDDRESATWTFYTLATIKGRVSFRWLGRSNGCYSEKVYLRRMLWWEL